MSRSYRQFLTMLLWWLAATTLAGASLEGSFERTYQVSSPADLQVMTRSGDIAVRSGPAGTVTIRGKIHVSDRWLTGDRHAAVSEVEQNPPIHQTGNSIRIDYVSARGISVDYEITVPTDSPVHTHSGSGDQTIEGLRASLSLESGSGDMRVRDITGEVHLRTGSGDVDAHDVAGPFHAETGSGTVRLQAKGSGDVDVRTGSGEIELRDMNGALEAETGSGDVNVSGVQTGTWNIRTSSGDVDLQLPAQAAFDLAASTGSGQVVVDRPVTMIVQGEVREARKSIHGKVAGGGPQLTVHTGSGDVHIN